MITVAALYIDPLGPYPKLSGVDCWDEQRDARLYAGPWPVVAHPPCGPWGKLAFCSRYQPADCGPRAVEQVRAFGGCLEHPAGSRLFAHCGMPRPDELPDAWGGRTIEVEQVRWGHVARKRTWVYLVGIHAVGALPPAREPTHWCSGFRSSNRKYPASYKRTGCAVPPGIKVCSAQQRRRTPPAFAEWLVSLAQSAREPASTRALSAPTSRSTGGNLGGTGGSTASSGSLQRPPATTSRTTPSGVKIASPKSRLSGASAMADSTGGNMGAHGARVKGDR